MPQLWLGEVLIHGRGLDGPQVSACPEHQWSWQPAAGALAHWPTNLLYSSELGTFWSWNMSQNHTSGQRRQPKVVYFLEVSGGSSYSQHVSFPWTPVAVFMELSVRLNQVFLAACTSLRARPKWCSKSWILHSASTNCSLVWASSSSISRSWFLSVSFSSSVSSSETPLAELVPFTLPSLLKKSRQRSQSSTFCWSEHRKWKDQKGSTLSSTLCLSVSYAYQKSPFTLGNCQKPTSNTTW